MNLKEKNKEDKRYFSLQGRVGDQENERNFFQVDIGTRSNEQIGS